MERKVRIMEWSVMLIEFDLGGQLERRRESRVAGCVGGKVLAR